MNAAREQLPEGPWYVQRNFQVHGPLRREEIVRSIALGRIRATDQLSQDAEQWQPLAAIIDTRAIAMVVPGSSADERRVERRRAGADLDTERAYARGPDRRHAEDSAVISRRAHSERVWATLRGGALQPRVPVLVTALLLCASLALAVRWSVPVERSGPDCAARAAPAVNWDFCAKPALELSSRIARLVRTQCTSV